ncbi:MAG: hypothetical protein HOW73_09360 [Polyangiaceae bacterium]|nr:hypothetical protein [Polyangiaceae bacterium]
MAAGCSDDKPYVPWSVSGTTSAEHAAPPAESAVAPLPSGGFPVVLGSPPSGDASTFKLGAGSVKTRTGRVFKSGLAFDATGDDQEDLFAWTTARDGSKGELVFFQGGGEASAESVLGKLPNDLDIGECSREAVLKRIGHGVVVVSVAATCGDAQEKTRWIAVGRVDRAADASQRKPPEMRLTVQAKAPLDIDVSAADKDADQQEDLVITARGAGAEAEAPSANLALWDRPSGYAWDPAEPEASLGKLGQALLARAVAKKPDATSRAENALRFVRDFCTDLGGTKLKTSAGAPKCQESRVIGDSIHAIGFAANTGGDIPRAVAASETIAGLKFDFGRVPQVEGLFAKKVKKVDAVIAKRPSARASTKGPGTLSPLMFDGTGGLLVAGDAEVTRVDLATGEETKSDATPWSRTVGWVSGDATIEIASATRQCSPPSVSISAGARGSHSSHEIPVLGSFVPGVVQKDKCDKKVDLSTILIDNGGAVIAIGGEIFRTGFGDQGVTFERAAMPSPSAPASPPGSARSPDGKTTVLALPKSLLVIKESGIERWKGNDLASLSECVVTSSGDHVACLSGEAVVIVDPKTK